MDYELSEKYKVISEAVIDAVPELRWIRDAGICINYEKSYVEKKHSGKRVLAECRKVPEEWKLYCPCDFRIIVYENNIIDLSENQVIVLLWHEHLHIGMNEKNGELTYIFIPHDIEDFHSIVDRFGARWADAGADLPDITKGGG